MIDLYYWPTPNGHKITMFLEEAGLDYRIIAVDISAGEQFEPAFLAISPNNRMPAIVDHHPADGGEPLSVFESGAILLYLSEKTGRFLPTDLRGRKTVLEWLFWQVGGLGPMAGQNHHFVQYAVDKLTYAVDRYVNETNRLYGVLDRRLRGRAFIAGEEYSIADMAAYPWIVPWKRQMQNLDDFPDLRRWFEAIRNRPATIRAYEKGKPWSDRPVVREESRSILFGQTAGSRGAKVSRLDGPVERGGGSLPEDEARHLRRRSSAEDPGITERYFEDFAVGQRFETGTYTLDVEPLFEFARSYDPQPFHLDPEAAARSIFRGLAASGWHTAAITIKLLVESDLRINGGIVGRVIESLEWPRPVRPGDTLHVSSEVLEVIPSRSRPAGKVRLHSKTINQSGEVVQAMSALLLVPSR